MLTDHITEDQSESKTMQSKMGFPVTKRHRSAAERSKSEPLSTGVSVFPQHHGCIIAMFVNLIM